MTVYVVMTVARQFMGELIFVRSEKGFKEKNKAEEYAKGLSQTTKESINAPGIGVVECALERGIYKIEIEE